MNSSLLVRLGLALLTVLAPQWLITHMPAGSAFAADLHSIQFDTWQGLLVLGSLAISCVMARFLARL